MNMKKTLAGAVATAFVAPVAAIAAIDDQGMQYVSASEGLGGSLRVDVLIDTDEEGKDVSSATNSLRLWTAGDIDLGGGMQSTYYIELRDRGGGESDVYVDAYDIGLKGPFGHVTFGHLGMVAFRLTPSASLAFERGTNREAFGADPGPNGVRYESPVINGFQFGVSGRLDGSGDPDGSLDEYSLGVKYTLPIGLEVGAGYEVEDVGGANAADTYAGTAGDSGINTTVALAANNVIWFGSANASVMTDLTVNSGVTIAAADAFNTAMLARNHDSMSGFRFGTRYSQDNWLVAYEYRGYDGFKPVNLSDYGVPDVAFGIGNGSQATADPIGNFYNTLNQWFINGDDSLEYKVHAVGAKATVDRVTMSAGFSMEENTVEHALVNMELEREAIAIDAAYALGSKSHMVIGWKREDYTANLVEGPLSAEAGSRDVSTTYLFYRVDF